MSEDLSAGAGGAATEGGDGGSASNPAGHSGNEGSGSQILGGQGTQGSGSSPSGAEDKAAGNQGGDAGDWRSAYFQGLPDELRERAQKKIERYASQPEIAKALLAQESKIGELSTRVKVPTGKDDDPKEIEAFRKAIGVPEAPEKYSIPEVQGFKWDDGQKAAINEFAKVAHAANMSQAQFETSLKVLAQNNAQAARAFQEQAQKRAEAVQEDLRAEYGREYKANIELANRWVADQFGPHAGKDGVPNLMSVRLADGAALGENPTFVRWAVAQGRAAADHGALDMGDGEAAGKTISDRIAEIHKFQSTNPKQYRSESVQKELMELTAREQRMKAARGGQ